MVETGEGQEEAFIGQAEGPEIPGGQWRILYCVRKKRYLGQWHHKRERFLPGYLFWVTDKEGYPKQDLGYGRRFCPIKQEEEELLLRLTCGKDEISMSYGVIHDGILKIYDGALVGMESRVRKIDRHKRKGIISMEIGNKEILAEVGMEITEKTGCGM